MATVEGRKSQAIQQSTFLIRPSLWALGLAPLAWLLYRGWTDNLTADPVKYITHFTGKTVLIILFVTLAVTPVRRLTGWNRIVQYRRLIGLFAFFYAVVHLLIYFAFDRGFVFAELGEDIVKRPYITVGFTAWMILFTLAVTSPTAMVRRLGRRWKTIHRFIYLAAALGILHFAWAQKKDLRPVIPYAVVLGGLLAARAVVASHGSRVMRRETLSQARSPSHDA
jgi:methionine sulfoxide reductase heme-binding subunit